MPLATSVGADTWSWTKLETLYRRSGDRAHIPAPLLSRMVAVGEHGWKTRRGFYGYTPDGERESRSDSGVHRLDVPETHMIGIVGSGTMASGIAEAAVAAGYPITIVARSRAKAEQAVARVGESMLRAVRRVRIAPAVRNWALDHLRAEAEINALQECDLLIEAVAEDIDIKRAVFGELDKTCKSSAVLATTTSSLSVTACADATGRPAEVVGLHFFNPVPAMRLVELVRTEHAGSSALDITQAFCERLGKTVIECGDRCGFIVNFLLFPYLNDTIGMLDATDSNIDEIDVAIEQGFGYPIGPFALMDIIGLDVCLSILRRLHEEFPNSASPPNPLLEQLVVSGRLGRKSGGGFRSYDRLAHRW